jgi:prepilin-type N-terminal cleavage/methylation domain-containing protein
MISEKINHKFNLTEKVIMKFTPNKRRKGFTLVELLVVISIIALLLSVLMPALKKAREQAQKTICVTNCKQFGLGVIRYNMDNSNHFPAKFGIDSFSHKVVKNANALPFCYFQDGRLNLRDIFIKPYIGEEKYTRCPGDRSSETWASQLKKNKSIALSYGVYVGYLPGAFTEDKSEGYVWGFDRDNAGHELPLKLIEAYGRMAVVGCIVRNRANDRNSWAYSHPYHAFNSTATYTKEKFKGQPNGFVDGSAASVAPADMTGFTLSTTQQYRFWWPNYPGFIIKGKAISPLDL